MAADPHVLSAIQVIPDQAVNGTVKPGDPVYHDGTGIVRANATNNAKHATFFALGYGDTTYHTKVAIAKQVIVEDADAPYSAGEDEWLHTTVGPVTSTKPSGSDNLEQRLGYAYSTSILQLVASWPRQVEVAPIHGITGSGETGTVLDSGTFAGDQLDANSEASYKNFMIPGGFISWEANRAWNAVETDVSFDYILSVSSAEDGEAWDVEGSAPDVDATANGIDQTPDAVGAVDISGSFDLSGISEPGKLMGVKWLRDTSSTPIDLFLGIELVANIV